MNLARSVAEVLAEHVSFELECIDRMYCNVYQPRLQHVGGVVGYVRHHLGLPVPATVPLGAISDRFIRQVHAFAATHQVPWVDFVKGQRKDDVMHERLKLFEASGRTEGVVFVGRAQEKTTVFRTEKRRNAAGHSYPWIVQTTGMVNHFYFYCVDADFGPFFLKFCSYFPYTAKLCLLDHDPIAGTHALHNITDPILATNGSRVPGLPIGKPRSQALLSALLTFRTQLNGFTNRDLRQLTGQLRGLDPATVSAGQATYDLRRLRTHQLIEKIPHSHRYRVTDTGLRTAMLLTRIHDRYLPTALATQLGPSHNRLKAASDSYQRALDQLARQNGLAA